MNDNYPLFVSVGWRFAFVPGGKSVIIKGGFGEIVGGHYNGVRIKGVTGAATTASFFGSDKKFKEVPLEVLLEEEE